MSRRHRGENGATRKRASFDHLPAAKQRELERVVQILSRSPEAVANATLDALARRRPLALVGAARLLPALLRLVPETAKRLVSKT